MRMFNFLSASLAPFVFSAVTASAGEDLRSQVHAWVMEQVPAYEDLNEPKVMAVCINWRDENGKVSILNAFTYYTGVTSDGAIFVTSLENSAIHDCKKWRKAEKKECLCQPLDRNGQNVLELP